MFKYYVIATCIVLTIAVLATAWSNRDRLHLRIAPGTASTSPHPGGFEGEPGEGNAPLRGDAPWALSALPECLKQDSISRGTLAYVKSQFPRGATAVPPGSVLRYGPCTILVRDGEAVVSRGADRLRIPPHVTLYRAGSQLALLRDSGTTGELRIYSTP